MSWLLVTGAGKRLGRAVALAAGARGWDVIVHYHASRAAAEETAAAIRAGGAKAALVEGNLSAPAAAEAAIEAAAKAAGAPPAGLVNCAAIFEWDDAATFTAENFRRHMETNALAPTQLSLAFARALPADGCGAIVNFLDFKLASPYPDHFSYTLSKYALAGATEMMARALAPRVRVNAVAPGYVLPAPGQAEADHKRLHAQNPLRHGVTPDDITDAVLFLLANPALTGQTVFVDSGLRFQAHERDFAFR
jgi:NAD(P)-dependent dehydrogenase (short-subunit alcohol dehydrogenase family)